MPDVKDIARDLLSSGAVEAVIGYEAAGPHHTRPLIARTAEEAERLVFNHSALNNLAVYLSRQKRPGAGKVAVVAKGCDARAIVMLIQEQQIDRDSVFVIGVHCGGVTETMGQDWANCGAAAKCIHCTVQAPFFADAVAGEAAAYDKPADTKGARIGELAAMSAADRFAYWAAEFDRCIRCHACRQVCPMCYCEQCIADKNMPQWIETSASLRGNTSWNIIRAFHLGGRCVGCNECERACPADIPLSLLNRTLGMTARAEFNYVAGMDPASPTLVGTYNASDREEYIK
ncbi:MAG: 4Fe-4S dicluster domain-containing protein [Ignavibacteriae bacterium]|nr:4Fe-4S dicluster domain-containing protein [Ignavibacteriota bacterium]